MRGIPALALFSVLPRFLVGLHLREAGGCFFILDAGGGTMLVDLHQSAL
jgi:hypothetical protein